METGGPIEQERKRLGLEDAVQLPGFVHASTTEQWGLVVNEAMAAGLPVAVSNRCRCAGEWVSHGENGYTFDPFDETAISNMPGALLTDSDQVTRMGIASRKRIQDWSPERFGKALWETATLAFVRKQ